ncbi:unnamed protein product, partial [marine sediment metagenome]
MKSNIKTKRILLSLTIIILISVFCIFNLINNEELNQIENNDGKFLGTPLSIDNNWTAIEAIYDWCTGAGIENNPYIIENVSIDAQSSGSCINIQNSNDYFIIQNCILYSSNSYNTAGITLYNITNGKIINNH